MPQMKVKFLRPLNGDPVGTEGEYSEADAKRLAASGAVEILGKAEEPAVENKMEAPVENKAAARKTSRK